MTIRPQKIGEKDFPAQNCTVELWRLIETPSTDPDNIPTCGICGRDLVVWERSVRIVKSGNAIIIGKPCCDGIYNAVNGSSLPTILPDIVDCPHCVETSPEPVVRMLSNQMYAVICPICRSQGPPKRTELQAIIKWNERDDDA